MGGGGRVRPVIENSIIFFKRKTSLISQISIIKNNIIVGIPDFPGNCVQEAGVPGPEEEGK